MRILIPVLGFGRAGGNRVLSQLATTWKRDGHHVVFISPDTSEAPYFPTQADIIWVDQRGQHVAMPHGQGMTGKGNLLSILRGIRPIHKNFDVVLSNHSLTTWPVWLAGVPRDKRFYYIQAYEPEYYADTRQRLNRFMSTLSYRLPFAQIVNATTYPGLGDQPFVPFGIDLGLFYPRQRASDEGSLVIGTIGRSEPGKGTRFVTDAFQRVRQVMPQARLQVAYGNLPSDAVMSGVEVVKPRNDAELADFYRGVDILIAGTYGQTGAPHYPVLEAMACGVPIIHTGYLPGTTANSWIANPCDDASLAEQVFRIVKEPAEVERRRIAAFDSVRSFAWENVAANMVRLFTR